MNRTLIHSLLATALVLPWSGAAWADAAAGQKLHDQHCLKCHDTHVYTRKDHSVRSLSGLRNRIRMCEMSRGLHWSDSQFQDVVDYLDSHFYHFGGK